MSDRFRLTMAQLNPVVGDLGGNRAKALAAHEAGREAGADFVALPEMFLVGYQPQDLVLKPAFTAHAMAEARALAEDCAGGPPLGIGLPWAEDGQLYNVYAILSGGRVSARRVQWSTLMGSRIRGGGQERSRNLRGVGVGRHPSPRPGQDPYDASSP